MLRIHLTFAALVASLALSQSRVDDFTLDALVIERVHLSPLPDGGCVAEWCGVVTSADGGVTVRDCAARELRNATNQNRCAALTAAGLPALGRQLRLTLDGGAQ